MRSWPIPLPTLLLGLLAGCAGPLGPPLGLGPGLDQIGGIAIFGILVAVLYRPLREHFLNRSSRSHPMDTPQEIARERYARGQINHEEFERIMRHLIESQGDSA